MKIYLFYRPDTGQDYDREVFLKTLGDHGRSKIDLVNAETREGDARGRLYDIMSYPSVVVTTDEGLQIKMWHGELPPKSELDYYLH